VVTTPFSSVICVSPQQPHWKSRFFVEPLPMLGKVMRVSRWSSSGTKLVVFPLPSVMAVMSP
jgi:hypothetical protein